MLIDDRMQNLAKLMDVAMLRNRIHAANLANQNTPGYKTREVKFEESFRDALNHHGSAHARSIDPVVVEGGGGTLDNDGNDVNTEQETLGIAQNRMLYEAYVAAMKGKNRILTTAIQSGS